MSIKSHTRSSQFQFLVYYVLFGILHEVFHLLAATSLGLGGGVEPHIFLFQAFVGRACRLPQLDLATAWEEGFIRHAGWCLSLFTAFLLSTVSHGCPMLQWASWVTAIEAVSTDMLAFGVLQGMARNTLFCGNFGIILCDPSWGTFPGDAGKTALDLLEKMIEVTMIRGAQSGGVVSWKRKKDGNMTAIRSRVVNGKRTDLSKGLRRKLNRDVCQWGGKLEPTIQTFLGHTRFATSSKATFEGTHPHRWTPPSLRRVYPLDDTKLWNAIDPVPVIRTMENYVSHNGDLDFFKVNGQLADLETIQKWLELATGCPMPAPVDSVAIAGLIDVMRTAGCFGLSLRYALLIASKTAVIQKEEFLPSYNDYEQLGFAFEISLKDFCTSRKTSLQNINHDVSLRKAFVSAVHSKVHSGWRLTKKGFGTYFWEDEEEGVGANLFEVTRLAVDAFFDNDLVTATKLFMKSAIGSFGLMVSSSEDAHRQICLAARGQPMSIAFYPKKGIICYGSEQAAVKAALMYQKPGGSRASHDVDDEYDDFVKNTCRLDLDDLGGEVVLLDWGNPRKPNGPMVDVTIHQESKASRLSARERTAPLEGNEFVLPLPEDNDDVVLADLHDIPRALKSIQSKWRGGGLNRLTAWNLGRRLRERLQARVEGKIPVHSGTVDVLITGCEVSLWLGEQFASDLQKAFPKLFIKAVSSNKILGVFGQDMAVPAVGYPISPNTSDLNDAIVIIISQSGATFGPLQVSNLLQSMTRNIFLVSSEWDTQIGKQLRTMFADDTDLLDSHIFSTDVGIRPSEACSLTVAATHQLLTQLFEYISLVVLTSPKFQHLSGAVVTENDLAILERCNQDSISALEQIVGKTANGINQKTSTEMELRAAGKLWSDHVLEVPRAYLLTILYIICTVTFGFPLVTGLASLVGLINNDTGLYFARFLDSLIYLLLPQINIILIRIWQRRNLRHRMVGRTVVIGDIPFVSQAADAFLSKLFARSYSIAGLNVLSGNPSDHLIHRHTHRVVRGTLLICGRPDGRLTALTSSEAAVNLAVCQASSIQSIGGTCESITVGHNPAKLTLTKTDISLVSSRPQFLCEHILGKIDSDDSTRRSNTSLPFTQLASGDRRKIMVRRILRRPLSPHSSNATGGESSCQSFPPTEMARRSIGSLKGAYLDLQEKSAGLTRHIPTARQSGKAGRKTYIRTKEEQVLEDMITERKRHNQINKIFNEMEDSQNQGTISLEAFIAGNNDVGLSRQELVNIFNKADQDDNGKLNIEEFANLMAMPEVDVLLELRRLGSSRDERGLLQVKPSIEKYFGASLRANGDMEENAFAGSKSQHFAMELYESRVASLQRFVAMCVMFHEMGKQVQEFFPRVSGGYFGYRMDRTHSILRVATTASPVSGDAVRERMETLLLRAKFQKSLQCIEGAWLNYQHRVYKDHLKEKPSPGLVVWS